MTEKGENTKNFIAGEFVESKATKWIDVLDPVRARLGLMKIHRWYSLYSASQHKPCLQGSRRPQVLNLNKPWTLHHKLSRHGATLVLLLVKDSFLSMCSIVLPSFLLPPYEDLYKSQATAPYS